MGGKGPKIGQNGQNDHFWANFGLFMPWLCQLGELCQTYGTFPYKAYLPTNSQEIIGQPAWGELPKKLRFPKNPDFRAYFRAKITNVIVLGQLRRSKKKFFFEMTLIVYVKDPGGSISNPDNSPKFDNP